MGKEKYLGLLVRTRTKPLLTMSVRRPHQILSSIQEDIQLMKELVIILSASPFLGQDSFQTVVAK